MYCKHVNLCVSELEKGEGGDLEIPGITAASVCLASGFQTVSARGCVGKQNMLSSR